MATSVSNNHQEPSARVWRVLWKATTWNYKDYLQSVRENKTVPFTLHNESVPAGGLPFSMLPQAKGKRVLSKNPPRRGDKVIFVVCGIKGKEWIEVADGIVFNGFEVGTSHQIYPFTFGINREHTVIEEFA